MTRRLRSTFLTTILLAAGCTTEPVSNTACQEHPLHEVLVADADGRLRVLLTLRSDESLPIAEAQRRVVESLEGTTFEILRQPENFPTLALRVAEDAFCRLTDNELVVNMQEDRPEPPTGG